MFNFDNFSPVIYCLYVKSQYSQLSTVVFLYLIVYYPRANLFENTTTQYDNTHTHTHYLSYWCHINIKVAPHDVPPQIHVDIPHLHVDIPHIHVDTPHTHDASVLSMLLGITSYNNICSQICHYFS